MCILNDIFGNIILSLVEQIGKYYSLIMKADFFKKKKKEKIPQNEKTAYPQERHGINVGTILLLLWKYIEKNDWHLDIS